MAFKTQAEIWRAILSGQKIKYKDGEIVFLKDEILITIDKEREESGWEWAFNCPQHWSIYEEPKPKKKVTLYRYTYREDNGPDIEQTSWCSYGFKEGWSHHFTLLKTESKEVEYDDV